MTRINTLIFVTSNEIKFEVAAQVFHSSGISLKQMRLCPPEIQSNCTDEIAEYSAMWACQRLNQPVVTTDAGFYIEALNGFPGPFIKFVNEWFSAQDFLNLMQDRENRRVMIRDCLAYCQPDRKPKTFCRVHRGELATEPGKKSGTPMEQILIPEGYSIPISEIPPDEMVAYWSSVSTWQDLKRYLET